ncbi:MAG: cytochrome c, partial [Gammaproteobacteria bacterium]|nr:cytochrome c [Gammaproteobacteria bacterium]
YKGRCSLCHGPDGEGNGKMARIIKDPPPFNLTKSGVPYSYLKEIVTKGGEAMGRSGRMPPWGKELSRVELDSILLYVMSLRGYNPKK